VALRVAQIERGGLARDQADEALMRAQHGAVDGVAVQTFGGVELERVVDAQHIDRAHLGHHIGRDQDHDLVQPLLRGDLLRHGFAEPSQQDAGTSRRAPHVSKSSPVKPASRVAGSWRKTRQCLQFYSVGAAASPRPGPNRNRQNCGTVCGSPPITPYSQLRLVLPSKTPARGNNVSISPMLR
jgi:hypothetical protein